MSGYISSAWNYVSSFWVTFDPVKFRTSIKLTAISINNQIKLKKSLLKQLEDECITNMMSGKEFEAKLAMEKILIETGKETCLKNLRELVMILESREKVVEDSDKCPYTLKEAISSIIYVNFHLSEIRNIDELVEQIKLKFGEEFINTHKANLEMSVNLKILDSLNQDLITGPTILDHLKLLAAKKNIDWAPVDFTLYAWKSSKPPNTSSYVEKIQEEFSFSSPKSPSMYPELNPEQQSQSMYPEISAPSFPSSEPYPNIPSYSSTFSNVNNNNVQSLNKLPNVFQSYSNMNSPSLGLETQNSLTNQNNQSNNLNESDDTLFQDILNRFNRLKSNQRDQNIYPNTQNTNEYLNTQESNDSLTQIAKKNSEDDLNSNPIIGIATALYDFDATESLDLSCKTGETFDVLKNADGWLLCKSHSNGAIGNLPGNYLDVTWY